LVVSTVQFAGRVGETAQVPLKAVYCDEAVGLEGPLGTLREKILGVGIWRVKTTTLDKSVSIFPHRNHFLQDWYFLLAYSLVLRRDRSRPSPGLFPDFYEEAKKDQDQRRDNSKTKKSKVSGMFTRVFAVVTSLPSLSAEATMKLKTRCGIPTVTPDSKVSGHSGKKRAVQLADMHPLIKSTWVCFRAGWKMRAVHTIFDYTAPNKKNDQQVAKGESQLVRAYVGCGCILQLTVSVLFLPRRIRLDTD
jgi:hypothetical protein